MTEHDELSKRLESLAAAQRDTDSELIAQEATERLANLQLLEDLAALRKQVDEAEMVLFTLEQQLEELRATVRRAQ